jgi:hypothetical protein
MRVLFCVISVVSITRSALSVASCSAWLLEHLLSSLNLSCTASSFPTNIATPKRENKLKLRIDINRIFTSSALKQLFRLVVGTSVVQFEFYLHCKLLSKEYCHSRSNSVLVLAPVCVCLNCFFLMFINFCNFEGVCGVWPVLEFQFSVN